MSKEQHSNIRDTRHTDTRALEPCDLTAPNIEVHPVNQPNELYSTCDQAVFFFLQTPAMKDNSCRLHRSWSPTVNSVDTFSKLCLPFSRVRSLPPSLHLSLFQARGCLQDCLHRDIFSCLEMTNTLHAGRSYLLCFWFFFSLPFFFLCLHKLLDRSGWYRPGAKFTCSLLKISLFSCRNTGDQHWEYHSLNKQHEIIIGEVTEEILQERPGELWWWRVADAEGVGGALARL